MSCSVLLAWLLLACVCTASADLYTGKYTEQSPKGQAPVHSGFAWSSEEIAKSDESFLFEPKGVARSTRDCGTVDPANGARQLRPGTSVDIGDITMRMAVRRDSSGLTFHERWVAETASCFVDPSCANWKVNGRSRFGKSVTVTHLSLDKKPLHAYTFTDCIPTQHSISPEPFCVSAAVSITNASRCFEVEEVTLQCDGFKIERLPRTPAPPVALNAAIFGTPAADLTTLKQRGPSMASVRQRATAIGPRLCICVTEPCPCDNPILVLRAAPTAAGADGAVSKTSVGEVPSFDLPGGGCVCVTDPCPCAGGPIISLSETALSAPGGCICVTDPCPCDTPLITVHAARVPPSFCICVTDPCPCAGPFLTLLPPPPQKKYRPSHVRPLPPTDPRSSLLATIVLFLTPGPVGGCVCVTDPCPCADVMVWLSPTFFATRVDQAALKVDLSVGGCICITDPCPCAWPLLQLKTAAGDLTKNFPTGCICVTEPCPCDDVVVWMNPARTLPTGCICITDPCPCADVFSQERHVMRVGGGQMVLVPAATPTAIEARFLKVNDRIVWAQGQDQRNMQTAAGAGVGEAVCNGGDCDDVDVMVSRQGSSSPSEFFFSPASSSSGPSSKAQGVPRCPNNATGGGLASVASAERAADGVPGFVWWRPLALTYDFSERYGEASARRVQEGPFKYRLLPLDPAPPIELIPEEDLELVILRTSAGGANGGGEDKGCCCLSNLDMNVAPGSGSGSACGSGSGGVDASRYIRNSSLSPESACVWSDGTPTTTQDMLEAGLAMNLQVAHTDPATGATRTTVCEGAFMSSLALPRLSFFNSLPKSDPRRVALGPEEDIKETVLMVCGKTDHF